MVAVVVLAALYLGARVLVSYYRMRGARVVTCPENHARAGVELDAAHAAFSSLYGGPALRLTSCSRWPERRDCGRACLAEIADTGESCLLRKILTRWYRGKQCAYCGRRFGEIDWETCKPALMTPDQTTIDWSQVSPERIDEVLATHLPVCFSCHMATSFVRQHPALVVDRTVRSR
jgi:hypothetical protein